MKIYIRRIDNQAINKQISILKDTVHSFFDDKSEVIIRGKSSGYSGVVTILLATDPRLGGDIKTIISKENGMAVGDYLFIEKNKNEYNLKVVKPSDKDYEFINNYLINDDRHLEIIADNYEQKEENDEELVGYNKIFYGIPGCGKSYKVDQYLKSNNVKSSNVFRTAFHLDYTNSDFIGQILPIVNEENVTYEYIPGPFTKAIYQALSCKEMVYLVIEEINRGNAPAIFGDIFQLLDRKKNTDSYGIKGESEYPISNEFIEHYLEKNIMRFSDKQIKIPHNLTILATMNTSDQNVFPLDTAFKRRWKLERVEGNIEDCSFKDYFIPFTNITWRFFRNEVNRKICESAADGTITEDKKLGPWFAVEEMFIEPEKVETMSQYEKEDRLHLFLYTVMDYLFNDVCKFDKNGWFEEGKSFDDVCDEIEGYSLSNDYAMRDQRNLCLVFLGK